ncbi:hypothetical protein ACFL20_07460 [Spirochaetota bacterium]
MRLKSILFASLLMFSLLFSAGMLSAEDAATTKTFDPYAKVLMHVGYTGQTKELTGGDADYDLNYAMSPFSRFGGKFTLGNVKAHVELGVNGAQTGNNVYTRLLYLTYTFGWGELLVGQTYTPYTMLSPTVSNHSFAFGWGSSYDGRLPQIKFTVGGFHAAFIVPNTGVLAGNEVVMLPKIALGYKLKSGIFTLAPGFAFNVVEADDNGSNIDKEEFLFSLVAYLHAIVKADAFQAKLNFAYTMNPDAFGMYNAISVIAGSANGNLGTYEVDGDGKVENTHQVNAMLILSYKLNNTMAIGAGGAYIVTINDQWGENDGQFMAYLQFRWKASKNLSVVPEFAWFDYMKDNTGAKQGGVSYLGIGVIAAI